MTQIYSMTGFGSSEGTLEDDSFYIELKTVNNRFLDLNLKLPFEYSSFEQEISKIIKSKLSRGRVDLYLKKSLPQDESLEKSNEAILNNALINKYLSGATQLEEKYKTKISKEEILLELLKRKDIFLTKNEVFDISSKEIQKEKDFVFDLLNTALDRLLNQRIHEGNELRKVLNLLLKDFEKKVSQISSYFQSNKDLFKNKFYDKFEEFKVEIDETRFEQEVAILLEKSDITEELDRLDSHILSFRESLSQNSPKDDNGKNLVGRKLEFMLQEMSREINTVGSKCRNFEISSVVVDSKSQLEKLREQVLNIE